MNPRTKVVYRDYGLEKILTGLQRALVENIHVGMVGPKAQQPSADGRLTNADVGAINYYGSDDGHVPARRWLDEPFKNRRKEVTTIFRDAIRQILYVNPNAPERALDDAGRSLARMVRDRILASGIGKPNAPSTIAKKGFDHALVFTKALAEAVSHRLRRKSGDVLESGSAIGGYEAFEIGGGG